MPVKLNAIERKVLKFLTATEGADFSYSCFRAITSGTRINKQKVRRACRSLKRKGLTEFGRGLWTESGEPYGSGYRARDGAMDALKILNS